MALKSTGASAARRKPFLNNLYPGLTSFTNLLAAAKAAQRGKRWRPDVLAFNSRLETELFQLQSELRSFSYTPGSYRRFEIRDPKPRLISAAPFRDRVVHHALCAVIGPPLERRFLPTTFANRTGFGTHRALRRFIQASRTHRWVLTADIRLYFPSIDHQLLLAQLEQVVACEATLWLLATILANGAEPAAAIDAFPGDTLLTPLERPRGLPIGNLTSQFLANFHLDRFDHRLHRISGIGAYLRYVDDFALFAASREALAQAREVVDQELAALRLRLHPIKSQIRRCGDGSTTTWGSSSAVSPQHPSPPEPMDGNPAGVPEGSRPAPVISARRAWIRTAPAGWSVSQGLARAPFFVGFRRLSSSGNFGDPPGAGPLQRRQTRSDDPPP